MKTYILKQLPFDNAKLFSAYDEAKFDIEDYKSTYTGRIDGVSDFSICEKLFNKFNASLPNDFEGHSMSVSDVVVLIEKGKREYYYCEPVGWKNVTSKVKGDI